MGSTPRRQFLVAALALLATSRAHSQQARVANRIGFLGAGLAASAAKAIEALKAGLSDLGYVEGKSIAIEYRWGEGRYDRLRTLAAELVQLKPNLILSWGTPAILAIKQATSTLPVVMVGIGDPIGAGVVKSLAHPGGNFTGVSIIDADLAPKRIALLKAIVPNLGQMAVLRNPLNRSSVLQFEQAQSAARSLGIVLQLFDARNPDEIQKAFSEMKAARAQALTVLTDPAFLSHAKLIADLALQGKLPTSFGRNENVEAGGLMSYGPRLVDVFREGATYVDKILKGAKPADLPVQQPTKIALVINVRTARSLGISLSSDLQFRADELVQ